MYPPVDELAARGSHGKRPGPAVHDYPVNRDFTAASPNTIWLTDITEHRIADGTAYRCAIKDVYSNRIVGCAIDERVTAHLAVTGLPSLTNARWRPRGALIVHSDRGGPVPLEGLPGGARGEPADRIGGTGRIGRGQRGDGIVHCVVQKNALDRRRWRTRNELRYAIINWIENTHIRRQRLTRSTHPRAEFELAFTPAAAQSA